jgi:pilus assembly protein CpaF
MGDVNGLLAAFRDPTISEIIVNDDGSVYVEKGGRLEAMASKAEPEDAKAFLSFMVGDGEAVGPAKPYADLTAQDGSRVHVIAPPLTRGSGLALTIRKRPERRPSLEEITKAGTLPAGCAAFLKYAVEQRCNILLIGGTSSGKTTLLNSLAGCFEPKERVIVLEDSPEVTLALPHVLYLKTRMPDVTLRDLLHNTLRMRPDRIIVGEVRSVEAASLLEAMNIGIEGTLCTMHANSPREALNRLETLVMTAGREMPLKAVRSTIAMALDLIVFMARLPDGSRKICQITEVTGMEVDNITTADLFMLDARQKNPELKPTGTMPRFYDLLRRQGIEPPLDFFKQN